MCIDGAITEGRDLARHFNCKFIETSAKQRINVDEAFSQLVREIRRYNKVEMVFCCLPGFSAQSHGQEQQVGRPNIGNPGAGIGGGAPAYGGHSDAHGSGCCSGCIVM